MRLKILAAVLFSLICILPGSKAGFFSGLPLSYIEIYFSFFIFLTIFLTPWEKNKIIKKGVVASLFLFLVFQLFSFKLLPYGWSTCVYSNIFKGTAKLQSKCEPTTEYPAGESSYLYKDIDFDSKNMPLYFLNMTRFNFYEKGETERNSLPFILEAQTYIYPQENEKLIIRSDKNVLVKINGKELVYYNLNNPATFDLIPKKINDVSLKYVSSRDKDNQLGVKLTNHNFYKNGFSSASVFLASLYKILNTALLLILFFCLIYSFLSCFLKNEKKHRYILTTLGLMLLAFFILTTSVNVKFKMFFIPSSIILFFSSAYYLFSSLPTRKKILPFLFLIFFLNSAILTTTHLKPEETILFQGGGDELGHESFARSTFSVTSFHELLHSTEDGGTYYYQPLHRYLFAILHKISGESLWGPYLLQTFFFSLTVLFMLTTLKKIMGWPVAGAFLIIYFLFSIDIKNSVLDLMQSPLQQGIPFILIILGIAMVFLFLYKKEARLALFFLLGTVFGIAFMTRTDWLPIATGLFVFCLYLFLPYFKFNKKFTSAIFLFLGLSIFPLFIGYRNLHVAQEFSILPSAGSVNLSRNLLEASREKIPMSQSPFSKTIKAVFANFSGRYGELAKILATNVKENMIGKKLPRKIIWYTLPALILWSGFITFRKKLYHILSIEIIIVISFFSLILPSSLFFLHNGIAMLAIYDLFSVLIFSLCVGIILINFINKKMANAIIDCFKNLVKNLRTILIKRTAKIRYVFF